MLPETQMGFDRKARGEAGVETTAMFSAGFIFVFHSSRLVVMI